MPVDHPSPLIWQMAAKKEQNVKKTGMPVVCLPNVVTTFVW